MANQGDSAVVIAHDAMFPDTAVEADLDRLGSRFLISRPLQLGQDEERYRKLIQLLAFQPKQVNRIVWQLLGILFGTPEELAAESQRAWQVYEVIPNEIIVEIPYALTASGPDSATYFHTDETDTVNEFKGDYFLGGATADRVALDVQANSGTNTLTLQSAIPYELGDLLAIDADNPSSLEFKTIYGIAGNVVTLDSNLAHTHARLIPVVKVADEAFVDNKTIIIHGEGLIDIFLDFMNTLVKASGVRVRIERI